MYTKHFGLTCFPFRNEIAADEMDASAAMRELGTRLGHLVEMSGIGLVTGDSGSGKSSACRAMTARLHTGLYKVFYVPLSTGNPMDMSKSIAWEMGLSVERSRAALYRQIKNEVTRLATETRTRPLLILDEAQWLRSDVLEEMRLLTHYAMDSESRLGLLFCGQSELRRRVAMAVHEALRQRIVVRYHLPPLSREETAQYLTHLLRRAGTELPLFEPAAVEAIFQATGGLPRRINGLAHHTLLAAAVAKAKIATADHGQAAISEGG
jgi:type II secretory pathway predicted ATPase ExeA